MTGKFMTTWYIFNLYSVIKWAIQFLYTNCQWTLKTHNKIYLNYFSSNKISWLTTYFVVPRDKSCLISNSTIFLLRLKTKLPWNLAMPLWHLIEWLSRKITTHRASRLGFMINIYPVDKIHAIPGWLSNTKEINKYCVNV